MATHLNIVVVEDNDDLRSLLCAGLQNAGHRVTGLSCAEELEDQCDDVHGKVCRIAEVSPEVLVGDLVAITDQRVHR